MTKIAGSGSRIRIRIHQSEAWIRGSGPTPKCHGSATLLKSLKIRALKVTSSRFKLCWIQKLQIGTENSKIVLLPWDKKHECNTKQRSYVDYKVTQVAAWIQRHFISVLRPSSVPNILYISTVCTVSDRYCTLHTVQTVLVQGVGPCCSVLTVDYLNVLRLTYKSHTSACQPQENILDKEEGLKETRNCR